MRFKQSGYSLIKTTNAWSDDEGWELLFYYNLYRLGLALVLVALAVPISQALSSYESATLLVTPILGIIAVSILMFINIKRRNPQLHVQAHALFLLDIFFISILNLGALLPNANTIIFYLTTIAASAIIFKPRMALVYALMCFLLVLYHDYIYSDSWDFMFSNWPAVVVTGVGMLSIVISIGYIASRTRKAQDVVEQQELELADMDQFNQLIVDRLETGVLYFDDRLRIRLSNEQARKLIPDLIDGNRLVGSLASELRKNRQLKRGEPVMFRFRDQTFELSTTPLRNGILLNIEDHTKLNRRIQQTKLASVGRMASAIAHEIRNPLNAISHAAQLLEPADKTCPEENELIEIIRKHAKRIDRIIESISERSRPGKAEQRSISMTQWLQNFIDIFKQTVVFDNTKLELKGTDIEVYFDPTQLEQILTNLCQNSIKYADTGDEPLHIVLHADTDKFGTPYLIVSDNGDGIEEDRAEQLFEPFYTSDSRSTGLGLFLVREFCEINGATIDYFRNDEQHGFRIAFHLQPKINSA
ncbi:MAG: ATP-binding protein [Pseudomonadota bacterium]